MKFTSLRNMTVATRTGHAIEFKKGEPTFVPPIAWNEVQAAGAVPEEDLPEPVKGDTEPSDPADRAVLIEAAIEELIEKNARGTFGATGAPQVKVLSQKVGWQVSASERDVIWQKIMMRNQTA